MQYMPQGGIHIERPHHKMARDRNRSHGLTRAWKMLNRVSTLV